MARNLERRLRIQAGCYGARSRLGNSIKGRWRILSVSG